MANARNRSNAIDMIEDNGRRLTSEEDKRNYFYYKFKHIFSEQEQEMTSYGDWNELFETKTVATLDQLTLTSSLEEIKKATFHLSRDKLSTRT